MVDPVTEALDDAEDAVGGFHPLEGFRADIVPFISRLPSVITEFKKPADKETAVCGAWQQLQIYSVGLPSFFSMTGWLVVSDGVEALDGTLASGWEMVQALAHHRRGGTGASHHTRPAIADRKCF